MNDRASDRDRRALAEATVSAPGPPSAQGSVAGPSPLPRQLDLQQVLPKRGVVGWGVRYVSLWCVSCSCRGHPGSSSSPSEQPPLPGAALGSRLQAVGSAEWPHCPLRGLSPSGDRTPTTPSTEAWLQALGGGCLGVPPPVQEPEVFRPHSSYTF